MSFKTNPFRSEKAFITAVNEYLKKCKNDSILATAQGFCNSNGFRYELYENELQKKFPDGYAFAREAFFSAAVNAPRSVNPAIAKSIVDWHLKYYGSIVERNAEDSRITIEMDEETKKDAQ